MRERILGMPATPPTLLSIVAHYDDDLIFANPGILEALRAGWQVRTVFVTGGDAGRGIAYTEGRERGIMQAYDVLRGVTGGPWAQSAATLRSGLPLLIRTPNDPRISLTMLRLPDGNVSGWGFEATGNESLRQLVAATIDRVTQLETHLPVSLDLLRASLRELIEFHRPEQVVTLVPNSSPWATGDHSDHRTLGTIVHGILNDMAFPMDRVRFAAGYASANHPANVTGEDLEAKVDAFITYAAEDPVSHCTTREQALGLRLFGASLQRQYLLSEAELSEASRQPASGASTAPPKRRSRPA